MAAELGFEPRQTESESAVLPLHNSAMDNVDYYTPFLKKVKSFLKIFLKKLMLSEVLYLCLQNQACRKYP